MLRLLRYLQGYVLFEASGGFTERFLNLCKINNINLWGVKNDGVKVVAFTTSAEFENLDLPAENSGMDVKLIKESGLKTLITRYKLRFGAIVGMFLIIILILVLSGRVWEIEITPISGVKVNNFTESLAEYDIKIGAKIKNIDMKSAQNGLINKFPELRWVSVNIFGTKVEVQYSYAKKNTPIVDTKMFTNIVAAKSGKVNLVQCYRGTAVVKKGVWVPEGSLLISGIVKNSDMSESLTHASGKVFARTKTVTNKRIFQKSKKHILSRADSIYNLYIFGLRIPLGKKSDYDYCGENYLLLTGNNVELPLGIVRVDFYKNTEETLSFSERERQYMLLLSCIKEKRKEFSDVKFKRISYSVNKKKNFTEIKQKIVCVENIAMEQSGTVS